MKSTIWFCAVIAATMLTANEGRAVTLAQFTFPTAEAGKTGPGYDPTTVGANLSATAIGDPSGALSGLTISNPGYSSNVLRANSLSTGKTAAYSDRQYFSFTVTPDAGMALDLDSLTFDAARGGGSTPRTWYVSSSVDGFLNSQTIDQAAIPTERPTQTPFAVDLSASKFDNLNGAVEFRVYNSAPGTGSSLEYDDFTLNGSVVTATTDPLAQNLAGWSFDTGLTPDISTTGLSLTAMTVGAGVTADDSADNGYPTEPVLQLNPANSDINNEAEALAADAYVEWTLTPDAGTTLDLEELLLSSARGGSATPRSWFLYSDIDGFTAGNAIASDDVPTQRTLLTDYEIDLTAATFQGLMDPVTFRLYIATPSDSNSLEFDDIIFRGNLTAIVVPEPSTLALAAFGLMGMMFPRRWRR